MGENWVSNLDMLAAGGVIDFDAPAYLLDQPARYVGNPMVEGLPMENPSLLPEGVKLKDVPKMDEYNGKTGNVVENPKWKKAVFGILAALGIGGAVLGVLASRGKFKFPKIGSSKIKIPKFKMPKFSGLKNAGTTVLNYIKKPFKYIAGKFTRTRT